MTTRLDAIKLEMSLKSHWCRLEVEHDDAVDVVYTLEAVVAWFNDLKEREECEGEDPAIELSALELKLFEQAAKWSEPA